MGSAVRDRGARARIREYLAVNGAVDDPSGRATAVLKEAVGYTGTDVGFIQLVAAMDQDGEIHREIRGKRTYRIASASAHVLGATAGAMELDYDRLARALLREVARAIAADEVPSTRGRGETDTSDLVSERDRLKAERDEYAARLEVARRQMSAILGEHIAEASADHQTGADRERAS